MSVGLAKEQNQAQAPHVKTMSLAASHCTDHPTRLQTLGRRSPKNTRQEGGINVTAKGQSSS
jgi:hypothetical protein